MRRIAFSEPLSGLYVKCDLLDEAAPESAGLLWSLASVGFSCDALHGIWTGPEFSIPMPANILPDNLRNNLPPLENATSFPEPGDIVLAALAAGSQKGLPPGNFFDIGMFYGAGGRLLMPFGWLQANVCAKISEPDLTHARDCIKSIQRNGICKIKMERCE